MFRCFKTIVSVIKSIGLETLNVNPSPSVVNCHRKPTTKQKNRKMAHQSLSLLFSTTYENLSRTRCDTRCDTRRELRMKS